MRVFPVLKAGLTRTIVAASTADSLAGNLARILPPLQDNAKRLYLLRHGQTDWNAQGRAQGGGFDIELNENGRHQAEDVAEELDGLPIDIVASSHLLRARQTADIVHGFHPEAERIVLNGLGEMRFGQFEGCAIRGPLCEPDQKARYNEVAAKIKQSIDEHWPGGGESTRQVESRGRQALQALMDREDAEHICVVAHGRFNKIMLASILHQDATVHQEIVQGNTCVNVLDVLKDDASAWEAQLLNYIDHVDPNTSKPAPS